MHGVAKSMKSETRIYQRGWIDSSDGWFGYIPPRHKKRIKKHCKSKNHGRKKDNPLYVNWWDFVEIQRYKTVMYA